MYFKQALLNKPKEVNDVSYFAVGYYPARPMGVEEKPTGSLFGHFGWTTKESKRRASKAQQSLYRPGS